MQLRLPRTIRASGETELLDSSQLGEDRFQALRDCTLFLGTEKGRLGALGQAEPQGLESRALCRGKGGIRLPRPRPGGVGGFENPDLFSGGCSAAYRYRIESSERPRTAQTTGFDDQVGRRRNRLEYPHASHRKSVGECSGGLLLYFQVSWNRGWN